MLDLFFFNNFYIHNFLIVQVQEFFNKMNCGWDDFIYLTVKDALLSNLPVEDSDYMEQKWVTKYEKNHKLFPISLLIFLIRLTAQFIWYYLYAMWFINNSKIVKFFKILLKFNNNRIFYFFYKLFKISIN